MVDQQARGVDLDGHVGQHELQTLEGRDGLPELLPFLRIAGGGIQRRLGDPDRGGAGHGPGVVEGAHRDLEALTLGPQTVFDRHLTVLQMEGHGRRRTDTHLPLFFPDGKPLEAGLDEEGRYPPRAPRLVDGGKERDDPGVGAVRAPELAPVQNVAVALPYGRRLQVGGIGAGTRLGERIGGQDVAGGQPGKIACLLLVAAGQKDGVAPEGSRPPVGGGGGARPGDLFGDEGNREGAQVSAAIGLRDPDAEQSLVGQQPHDLRRIALGLVVLGRDRGDLLACHLPREIAYHPLLVAEIEELLQRHGFLRPQGLSATLPAAGLAIKRTAAATPGSIPRWSRRPGLISGRANAPPRWPAATRPRAPRPRPGCPACD